MRRPGFETLLMPRITASLVGEYFKKTRIVPFLPPWLYSDLKLAMKPSSLSRRTISSLSFEYGTSTRSLRRAFEFRILVNKSAMGSISHAYQEDFFTPGIWP